MKRVFYPLERDIPAGANLLMNTAQFYQWIDLDGRRITPLSQSLRNSAGSSIVKACHGDNAQEYSGEVLNIFHHRQLGVENDEQDVLLAEIRWMREEDVSPVVDDPWSDL